ncbi:hypothetical protein JV173_02575 [Acholeplasma equirhinis]|uniref:hypothetical protein n=1 Tax=Acholeplasma equirhinis TaxID=555393 RepID=UPI00197AEF5A|nr:hypothetical protein [Acholeplasma equirhinis]MBN3490393.1 hypothetical protein [Acholeplasma equirhinis]
MKKIVLTTLSFISVLFIGIYMTPMLFAVNEQTEIEINVVTPDNEPFELNLTGYYGEHVNMSFAITGYAFHIFNGEYSQEINRNFLVSHSTAITMILKEEEQVVAAFVDSNGKFLYALYGEFSLLPTYDGAVPTKPGFKFTGFNLPDYPITSDTVFVAQYEMEYDDIEIIIDGQSEYYVYNSVQTIYAEDGFHWEEYGIPVSVGPVYEFSVIYPRKLVSVEGLVTTPNIVLSNELTLRGGHKSYLGQYMLTEGYEFVEAGLVVTETFVTPLTIENGTKIPSTAFAHTNEFLRSLPIDKYLTVRAYLIVKNDNNLEFIYSDNVLGLIDVENFESYSTGTGYFQEKTFGRVTGFGNVSTTAAGKIDNNTFYVRINSNYPDPKVVTIDVTGFDKVLVDLKLGTQSKTAWVIGDTTITGTSLVRNFEIQTNGEKEITLTFVNKDPLTATNWDGGLDNIRFFKTTSIVQKEPPVVENPENPTNPSDGQVIINDGFISMYEIAVFLQTKNEHYPISDMFIEDHQQASGGYIALAKSLGILVDKSQHSPNQKWHFFDSWMYPSIAAGTLSYTESAKTRVYSKLLSPELLLWIYEACDVPVIKIQNAYLIAVQGRIAGTSVSTIAKNMRNIVPWSDLEVSINAYLQTLY